MVTFNLKGYRTKITGAVMGFAPAAAYLGYQYDPEVVKAFIEKGAEWLTAGYALGAALVYYFRDKAGH